MERKTLDYETDPDAYSTGAYTKLLFDGLQIQNDRSKQIAIIGAGMSGLVSGWLLKRAGHHITIFEATSIVGGRVKTLRDRFTSDYYAEAGAMRIPSQHSLTIELLSRLGLLHDDWTFPNSCPEAFFYINNQHLKLRAYDEKPDTLKFTVLPHEQKKTARALFAECLLTYMKRNSSKHVDFHTLASLSNTATPEDALSDIIAGVYHSHIIFEQMDQFSLRQFLNEESFLLTGQQLSQSAADHICSVLLLDMSLSSSMIAVLRNFNNVNQSTKFYQIKGGMDQLPKAFVGSAVNAKALDGGSLQDHVYHNCRVIEIAHDNRDIAKDHSIRVDFETPVRRRGREFFDIVIVSIPFPALRHVRMFMLASPEKRRAMRQLHYDNACKILMEFTTPFWLDEFGITGGRSVTDLPIRQICYPNRHQNDNPVS